MEKNKGCIYILTNQHFPNLLKFDMQMMYIKG